MRYIGDELHYVGYSDRKIKLFENYIPLNFGVSYNSYLIVDNKTCLLDTVDYSVVREFISDIKLALNGKNLDYLIVNHMEPDHAASILEVVKEFNGVKIVTNAYVLKLLNQFFDYNFNDITIVVKENDTINLGKHELTFITAPFVHWPEVMFTYDKNYKTLFSADAFGSFGALSGNLFYDEVDDPTYFIEARRYYTNIVGKYGKQVVNAYLKIKDLDIKMICPLHSYLWRKDFNLLIDKYVKWATYEAEDKEVILIYASMYGNTEKAAMLLADELANKGLKNIKCYDVSNVDETYLIGEIFRVSHIVFLSPTYNANLYPRISALVHQMQVLDVKNKTFALVENSTWAPRANSLLEEELNKLKDINIIKTKVSIKSALKEDTSLDVKGLASLIAESILK